MVSPLLWLGLYHLLLYLIESPSLSVGVPIKKELATLGDVSHIKTSRRLQEVFRCF